MSKPFIHCPSSISSSPSSPYSRSASPRTPVARRRPLAAATTPSPPAPPTLPPEPSCPPPTVIALPPPPPLPSVFGPAADDGNAAGGDRGNKKAWNAPNVGEKAEVPLVMGADSWPALAESVSRASAKSSASGSPKVLSDGSSIASDSKGGDGSSSSSLANDGPETSGRYPDFSDMLGVAEERRQESSSEWPANEGNSNSSIQFVPQMMQQVDNNHRRGNHVDKGRGNSGGRPGGSSHNWRRGNRHGNDQRACHWNGPSKLGRNPPPPVWMPFPPLQTQSQPFLLLSRPPARPVFIPMPPHVHPFMSFLDMDPSPPYRPRGPPLKQMPFIGPQVPPEVPLALLFPQVPQPRPKLKEQIEYYFSDENLCKDVFLRKHMDDQGWVPVSLIATFNRVRLLTTNIQYILNTLQDSEVVEVQGAKIRRRDKWMNWLLPSAQTYNELLGSKPGSANQSSIKQTLAEDSKVTQNANRPPQ